MIDINLVIDNITVKFGNRAIFNDISFTVRPGDILALTGESGCGKTTFLNAVMGILNMAGTVTGPRRHYITCDKSLIESLSIYDNMRLIQSAYKNYKSDIKESLDMLGISGCMEKYPRQLSSGEYKRAAFAAGIISGAGFLLLDEPTSNLDDASAEIIILNMRRIAGNNTGIIVATHDSRIVDIADSIIIMKG